MEKPFSKFRENVDEYHLTEHGATACYLTVIAYTTTCNRKTATMTDSYPDYEIQSER